MCHFFIVKVPRGSHRPHTIVNVPQRPTSPIYTHHDNSISASFCPQNRSPLQVITRGSYINARRRSRSKRRCMKNPWGVRPSSRNLGQEYILTKNNAALPWRDPSRHHDPSLLPQANPVNRVGSPTYMLCLSVSCFVRE